MSDPSPATRNPVFLLAILLAVATTGCRRQAPAPEPVETVEVLVAAKDLPVGTYLAKAELPTLVTKKTVPKASLPMHFVTDEAELVNKRLKRPVRKDETFNPADLHKHQTLSPQDVMDLMTLPIALGDSTPVVPGSRVDILAGCRRGGKLEVFVLLEDLQVLAVAAQPINFGLCGPDVFSVTFAVNQEQALLLTLAKQRGCVLEVVLRAPGKPTTMTKDDYKKRAKVFQEWLDAATVPVAPAPRVKGE